MFRDAAIALEHAESKHPNFADSFTCRFDTLKDANVALQTRRELNARAIEDGRLTSIEVLDCELLEAREAFIRGSLEDFNMEMAQVLAVTLRLWHLGALTLVKGENGGAK
ncbi:MAG: hypothetical protein ACI4Q3_00490 [Kiritimatiellia bacterium]